MKKVVDLLFHKVGSASDVPGKGGCLLLAARHACPCPNLTCGLSYRGCENVGLEMLAHSLLSQLQGPRRAGPELPGLELLDISTGFRCVGKHFDATCCGRLKTPCTKPWGQPVFQGIGA